MSGSNQGRLPMEAASPGTRRTGYMSKQAYVLCKGAVLLFSIFVLTLHGSVKAHKPHLQGIALDFSQG